jgi:hypothetical protein
MAITPLLIFESSTQSHLGAVFQGDTLDLVGICKPPHYGFFFLEKNSRQSRIFKFYDFFTV